MSECAAVLKNGGRYALRLLVTSIRRRTARYYFHVENRADLIKDEEGKSARTR